MMNRPAMLLFAALSLPGVAQGQTPDPSNPLLRNPQAIGDLFNGGAAVVDACLLNRQSLVDCGKAAIEQTNRQRLGTAYELGKFGFIFAPNYPCRYSRGPAFDCY